MQSVVTYVRNLLGWCEDDPAVRTSFKRDRTDEDFCLSNDTPTLKRLKRMKKTSFPDNMDSKDMWEESKQNKNIRYVPIRLEPGHPSTSTPNSESLTNIRSRIRTVPIKLIDVSHNGPTSLPRKSYIPTPTKPIMRAIIKDDDDDDDDQEVTWIETKSETKKPSKVYINLDDDDDEDNDKQEDDVIFVKKVTTPPAVIPYKYFVTKSALPDPKEEQCVKFYKVCSKPNDKNGQNSPRTINKFKTPAGITKVYKKVPAPLPKWMQNQKTNLSLSRNKFSNLNGNARSTLSEVFNLDEKRNYQELIKKFSDTTRHVSIKKSRDIIEIAEDAASLRCTQKSQKSSLNELKLMGKSYSLDKGKEFEEYDPITVASINSSDSEIEIIPSDTSTTSSVRVDPINTLRESLRDRPVTSRDWLLKLDSKYKKKKEETQAKLKDAHRESDIISKVNYEQKLAHLEHKLKYELSIPESLIEEVPPAVELPPLTPEQEKLVNKALGPGHPGQLLVEKFNLRIHRRDLQTLSGLNWLNDEVINFYMNLLMQRCEEQKDLPKVYATNTFFYPKLMQSGQAGLRRWTRKVDIFAHELMVVPVHLGVHWCLSLIDFRRKKISYLDSMGGANHACLHALLQYLRDEHLDKKGQPLDDSGWTTENLKDIPQQMNGSDCGVFACTFAEFSCREAPYAFSQAHMPYLRRKAALEILQARLLL